jgi:rubredoxin
MAKEKDAPVDSEPLVDKKTKRREVPEHRRCPLCHHGAGNGVGQAYATRGRKRYYKCDVCGHTWVSTIETHVTSIEQRRVELTER